MTQPTTDTAALVREYRLACAAQDKAFLASDLEAERAAQQQASDLLDRIATARGEDRALALAWIDAQE